MASTSKGPIAIGIGISAGMGAAGAAFGVELDTGDTRQQAMAVVNDINKHGGLAGRMIKPVFAENDSTDTRPIAQKEQEFCSTYTQDNHVLAVAGALGATTETLLPCLSKAGVPYTSTGGGSMWDAPVFRQFPLIMSPGMLNFSRIFPVMVPRLKANGWFGRWTTFPVTKVGIVSVDTTMHRRLVVQQARPALARAGFAPTDDNIYYIPPDQGASNAQQQISGIQNAVLKFRANSVSHVVFVENGGGLPMLFMRSADTQGYEPRYALSSNDSPTVLVAAGAPHTQLDGTMGIGWNPMQDVDEARDTVSAKNPAFLRCKKVMTDAGVNMSVRLTAYAAGQYCDTLYVLVQAATPASGWTGQGFMREAAKIGTSFQAALTTLGTRLTATQRDGVAQVLDLAWHTECDCFQYGRRSTPAA